MTEILGLLLRLLQSLITKSSIFSNTTPAYPRFLNTRISIPGSQYQDLNTFTKQDHKPQNLGSHIFQMITPPLFESFEDSHDNLVHTNQSQHYLLQQMPAPLEAQLNSTQIFNEWSGVLPVPPAALRPSSPRGTPAPLLHSELPESDLWNRLGDHTEGSCRTINCSTYPRRQSYSSFVSSVGPVNDPPEASFYTSNLTCTSDYTPQSSMNMPSTPLSPAPSPSCTPQEMVRASTRTRAAPSPRSMRSNLYSLNAARNKRSSSKRSLTGSSTSSGPGGHVHDHFRDHADPPDLFGPLSEEQLVPPLEDMKPDDPELTPHEQELRSEGDLYTPRYVRGHGNKREGWCGICKPGGWLVLKNSAYCYDKSFTHGISAVSGQAFEGPRETRRMDGNADVWEGFCGSCGEWIALVSSKKKGATRWLRHAYKVRRAISCA
jgi:Domain of unknown function (DUF4451)